MTKHLYLTPMLLTSHGKGPEKVNINIICFLPATAESHIWWGNSFYSQNSKDICSVKVRIILWEPGTGHWHGAQRKKINCLMWTVWVIKRSMCVRPGPSVVVIKGFKKFYPYYIYKQNIAVIKFRSTMTLSEQKSWIREFIHIFVCLFVDR